MLDDFKRMLATYQYSTFTSAYFDSENYRKFRSFLLDNLPTANVTFQNIHLCSYKEVKQVGREIVEKHTENIDIKVPYTFENELASEVIAKFGLKPDENKIDEIITYIKNKMELKKVTDVPVFTNINAPRNGCTCIDWIYDNNDISYYQKIPIILNAISLQGPSDDFSKGIYVHEMYHALTQRNKGFTKNYLYTETLPIFMEQVTVLDIDESLIPAALLKRIISIKKNVIELTYNSFNEDNIQNITSPQNYILSCLLAINLFNIYLHSSNKGKNEINSEINKILMGNKTLEEVLDKYEITPEKGASLVKKKIKTLK